MGLKVTAAEAARLVDRHERIIRWHVKRGTLPATKEGNAWAIDTDDLEGPKLPGWKVNRARLAELQERDEHTAEGLAAKIARMDAELQALRSRVRVLELRQGTAVPALSTVTAAGEDASESAPSRGHADSLARWSASDVSEYPEPSESHYSASYAQHSPIAPLYPDRRGVRPASNLSNPRDWHSYADAARWLERHGVSAHTPKSWPGWRGVVPLEPEALLRDALGRYDPSNWRITWRLHRCDDPVCVCRELLPV